ncbi:MAG: hypothetical protein A2Z72_08075 [Omnitrophica bacterium RBG_13_46_9]|nr:MAG: hypothetical protein A2Z72_08075 [Omnitrophica bacterium RBG_13_46_9]
MDKNRRIALIAKIAFLAILLLSLNLRKHTFRMPHFSGDQHHYVGLAFKLDTKGISGYNLRGIELRKAAKHRYLFFFEPSEEKGWVLRALAQANITYYDQPFHHIPFVFPVAIMLSHRIFAGSEPYYVVYIPDWVEIVRSNPTSVGLRNIRIDPAVLGKQFYSVIVPLVSSIILIVLVYLLAKQLYGNELVSLIAMFLMAISPVDILSSQKLWADDMTAMFTVLAVLMYILAVDKNKSILAFIGGISCGLGAITKQNGAFIVFVIVIWHFIANADKLLKKETFFHTVFDKNLILFGIGAVLSSVYWFAKITSVYGDPIYRPHPSNIDRAATIDWFRMVGKRPRYVYLFGIPYLNPLFALAYISPFWLWIDKRNLRKTTLLIIWMAVFFYIFQIYLGGAGKEHRYMLPSYAAFAILGGYVADQIRIFIDKLIGFRAGTMLLVVALLLSAFWCIPIGLEELFCNSALILRPF